MKLHHMTFKSLIQMAVFCSICFASASSSRADGTWSRGAVSLMQVPEDKEMRIVSPDNKRAVLLQGSGIRVEANNRILPGTEDEGFENLGELEWAPDSSAFFITESDGGNVGRWEVRVFLVKNAAVKAIDVTQKVIADFRKTYRCATPEEPNIGAVKWLHGSMELLLVAEVPPHSSCPEMGKLRGYVVKVPSGRIQRELSSSELKKDWSHYLGYRLK